MKFIVNRNRWYRGKKDSCLLNTDGKMCCLGFLAKQCGYSDEDIFKHWYPESVKDNSKFPNSVLGKDVVEIVKINDDPNISEDVRETLLKHEFNKNGILVKFEE